MVPGTSHPQESGKQPTTHGERAQECQAATVRTRQQNKRRFLQQWEADAMQRTVVQLQQCDDGNLGPEFLVEQVGRALKKIPLQYQEQTAAPQGQ